MGIPAPLGCSLEKPGAPYPSLVGPGPSRAGQEVLEAWLQRMQEDWETWDYQAPRFQVDCKLPALLFCPGGGVEGGARWGMVLGFKSKGENGHPFGLNPSRSPFPPPSPKNPHLVLGNLTAHNLCTSLQPLPTCSSQWPAWLLLKAPHPPV